jgi:hypothetical protein
MQAMRQLRPTERITRVRISSWMMVGIFASRAVHLRKIANHIPGAAKTQSKIRRLRRFLSNPAVQVREWYAPQARALLAAAAAARGEIRLIVDGTKVGFGHQLLMVAVAYRRRALPIAWTWIKGARGHSTSYKQEALLAYVRTLLPDNAHVLLVGDSEFGAVPLLRQMTAWGWHYVVRRKSDHLVQLTPKSGWQSFGSLIAHEGDQAWHRNARLTRKHAYPVHLYAYWHPGEDDPWLLATNVPTARQTHRDYARRMWLEEMFGDFKGHGFDLESTHLRDFRRLSRLTLLVVLLYLWLITRGSQAIKAGDRHLVDRRDRRDLSLFHIGFCMIKRYLGNQRQFFIRWIPYFA